MVNGIRVKSLTRKLIRVPRDELEEQRRRYGDAPEDRQSERRKSTRLPPTAYHLSVFG